MSEFYRTRRRADGLAGYCKDCADADQKRYREKNPDHRILRLYGIDQATYDRMLAEQGGCCAVCGGVEKRRLSIDHNHGTGRVRALLCTPCNLLLGNARESAEILRAAAHYIDRHKLRLEA